MILFLGLLIFSFIVSSILIVPFIDLLYKFKLTRRKEAPKKGEGKVPLFDKMHDWKAGTPIGGGILIIFLVCIYYLILFPILKRMGVYITSVYPFRDELNIIFFTFISFGVLGLYDDIVKLFGKPEKGPMGLRFGITRRVKFLLQILVAGTIGSMLYINLGIDLVHIPLFGVNIHLGWLYIPFAAFVILAFSNAYNITDGLDGLAAGLLMICLFAFWMLSATILDTTLTIFLSLWIGAIIAFLYFNVFPARIWMGDAGALSFGATLAVVGLLIGKIFALVFIGGLFLLEVSTSLIQIYGIRIRKRRFFKIAPLHLWLQAKGWAEPKIVARAWLAGMMLAIMGIWLALV
ncbi:phospho-N-acetylmuramoyl-pentapeptide-transferase [Patescibacteria group bacterium]|nr:phospho-N-acetylmuramoyl-pentapeptide-transferase [Patescibacteria group bacterium]